MGLSACEAALMAVSTDEGWLGGCLAAPVRRVVAARFGAAGKGWRDARAQVAGYRGEPVLVTAVDVQRDAGQPRLRPEIWCRRKSVASSKALPAFCQEWCQFGCRCVRCWRVWLC